MESLVGERDIGFIGGEEELKFEAWKAGRIKSLALNKLVAINPLLKKGRCEIFALIPFPVIPAKAGIPYS
jgi:hypothetical protein